MSKSSGKKLLNYTSNVEQMKTAGEIMGLLATKGAKSINIDYINGEPVALWFKIAVRDMDISYRLPCNFEGAQRALRRTAPPRYHTLAQAKRTAWRIIKDWVEAQLAFIECEQAEMAEVFLPYAIVASGQTLFQQMKVNPNRLLTAGDEPPREDNVIEGHFIESAS